MKTWRCLAGAVVLISMSMVVSCANNSQTASTTNPSATTHTGDDLQRTGKREAGEALKSADPAVTTTTGR
jgi:hypothetical protein